MSDLSLATLSEPDFPKERTDIYIFFSFDLENSTEYKSLHEDSWPSVFEQFYSVVVREMTTEFPEIKLWKYIGDEVLLNLRIQSQETIFCIPPKTFEIVKKLNFYIRNIGKFSHPMLAIKAATWMAEMTYLAPGAITQDTAKKYRNLEVILRDDSGNSVIDFLGPEIDAGFRLSKYAVRNSLIMSANMAHYLYLNRDQITDKYKYNPEETIKITDYEKLRGVWNNRGYPLVYYADNWSLESQFYYDEHLHSPIYKKFEGELTPLSKIKTIYEHLNVRPTNIDQILKENDPPQNLNQIQKSTNPEKHSEVHCVAICFGENGKFLAARRSSEKRFLPNVWEFGCGQLRLNQSFDSILSESYLQDFNIEIDKTTLKVISYYTITKPESVIPGIIFATKVRSIDTLKYSSGKHQDARFLELSEIDALTGGNFVENFKANATLAHTALFGLNTGIT